MSNVVSAALPLGERAVAEGQPAPPSLSSSTRPSSDVAAARSAMPLAAESLIAPATPQERIESIDVLRGMSLLGILLININSFGLPFSAHTDPSAYGGASGANFVVWLVNHVLFEGKMRAIFSMLFGASIIILTTRSERRSGGGVEVADIYCRRTLWLIAIGVLHAYLIWYGDILFFYGVVGLALFPFRKLHGRTLCLIGAMLLGMHALQGVRGMHKADRATRTIADLESIERSGRQLTAAQVSQLQNARSHREYHKPGAEVIADEINTTRGGYIENLKARAHVTASLQSEVFYRYLLWDIAGMLVMGMGLMKLGVFDASRSMRFYMLVAIVGYGVGVPLGTLLALRWAHSGFDVSAMFRYIRTPHDLVRFSTAAGHVAVIMMICKSGALRSARRALASAGRMALTNYLLMSVLCTLFFYGYGLGMFAKLQRYELLYVVVAVWAVNLILSTIWLRHFHFGPLEWVWRSLTYWKVQPMRIGATPAAMVTAAAAS